MRPVYVIVLLPAHPNSHAQTEIWCIFEQSVNPKNCVKIQIIGLAVSTAVLWVTQSFFFPFEKENHPTIRGVLIAKLILP